MKARLIIIFTLLLLFPHFLNGQNVVSLWVGEQWTMRAERVYDNATNIKWVSDNPYLQLNPSGMSCEIKATNYFSGTASVTISYDYTNQAGYPCVYSLTRYITCTDNPISITPENMTLQVNGQGQLSYSHMNNDYSSEANVTYSCSSDVVTVTSSGKVTGKKVGTAKVYVHSNLANDANAPYCTVIVEGPTVTLPKTMTLNIGESQFIVPIQSPGSGYSLSWRSSDPTVATVSLTGKVIARKKGTTRVTATINGYGISDYCDVTVTADPTDITIPHELTLSEGSTATLTPTVTPSGALYVITWTSSNTTVATVSAGGVVTAKKKGTAIITASIVGTTLTDNCNVTVTQGSQVTPGDVNYDGTVSISDVSALIDLLLSNNGAGNPAADVNRDGQINIADVSALIDVLLSGSTGGLKGDVNNDGKLGIDDVTVLIDYLLKSQGAINTANSDVDNDGNITIADVTALIDLLLRG